MKEKIALLMGRIEAARRLPLLEKAKAAEGLIFEAVALMAIMASEIEALKEERKNYAWRNSQGR